MLGWLPIIGPVIDGIVSIWKGYQDVTVQKGAQDVQVIQARAAVAIAFKDDIGVRLARDLIMFPAACWTLLIFWYCITHEIAPGWSWKILAVPGNLEYIPYAVIAFLFVTAFRK